MCCAQLIFKREDTYAASPLSPQSDNWSLSDIKSAIPHFLPGLMESDIGGTLQHYQMRSIIAGEESAFLLSVQMPS